MQTLVTYLSEKIRTARAHIACNLLKQEPVENLEIYLIIAIDLLQQKFTKNNMATTKGHGSHAGEANLTHASVEIGEFVLQRIEYDHADLAPWDWFKMRVMMGDLFIEVLYQHHMIDIGKAKDKEFVPMQKLDRALKRSRTHYIIIPENWEMHIEDMPRDLLLGTVFEMPQPIEELMQPTDRPVIKGWTEQDSMKFRQYMYRDWVQAINVLQQTGWRINEPIYKIIKKNKDRLLDPHKVLPKKYKSKLIEFDLTLARAEMLLGKSFYQYAECDYRGRIYFTTPFLNFQSNDIARGQMLFDKAKELTDEGRYWLAVHIACSYNQSYDIDEIPSWCSADYEAYLKGEDLRSISVDKMTLDDRVQWTMQNSDWLCDLWDAQEIRLEAEKPIAFLAGCQEWSNMWYAYENGETYYSRMPIPVDGSNNGWQHLAAMSKDPKAGALVGVVPQEIQKDFYVQCAKELQKLMPEWFSERQMPMKAIRKGIAKRGSMTRAYSAGAEKIAENMYLDCHVEGYTTKYNITEEDCRLLAKNLVKAIDVVCAGPLQTMKFLQKIAEAEIASDASKEMGRKSIEWTTPSGFPVTYESWVTNEFKEKATISCTQRGEKPVIHKKDGEDEISDTIRIQHVGKENTDIPKVRSFMSGISPNFVHSMDASHMAAVIKEWGGDFGAVHDSFSVHASDVPELLGIIKHEFIRMYDYPNFFDEIERMILKVDPLSFNYPQPEIGSLEIREVKDSDYFFA